MSCVLYGIENIPKIPPSLNDECFLVLPLKTKNTVFKGLGVKAFTTPLNFEVSILLRNDGMMHEWRRFYEKINFGGDAFFLKINYLGKLRYLLVKLTKLSPDFKRTVDGWQGTLNLQEVNPPNGAVYDDNGDWVTDDNGDVLELENCVWGPYSTGVQSGTDEETYDTYSCLNSYKAAGSNPEECDIPQTSVVDVFGDGSCLALYRFDGNTEDAGGNYNANSADNTYNIGYIKESAKFKGNNNGIVISTLPIDYNNFTISFWFTPDKSQTSFVYESEDGQDTNVIIEYDETNHSIRVKGVSLNTDAYSGNGTLTSVDATKGIFTPPWQFISIVFKTDHTVLIYIDGQLTTEDVGHINPQADTSIILGRNGFAGRLDQLRFFSRALAGYEIQKLYGEKA